MAYYAARCARERLRRRVAKWSTSFGVLETDSFFGTGILIICETHTVLEEGSEAIQLLSDARHVEDALGLTI